MSKDIVINLAIKIVGAVNPQPQVASLPKIGRDELTRDKVSVEGLDLPKTFEEGNEISILPYDKTRDGRRMARREIIKKKMVNSYTNSDITRLRAALRGGNFP